MSIFQHSSRRSSRGSVLIVTLILASIIGISLVSYLNLANNSLKQASRSFYANSAINIAEFGLEQAIACYNQLDNTTPAAAWTGWTLDSTPYNATTSPTTPSAKKTFSDIPLGPGAMGSVKVYVQHYEGSVTNKPKVVAWATVTQQDGPSIDKYIEVTLRKRSILSPPGLIAEGNVEGDGSWDAKSWNSDPDNDPTTPPVAWPAPQTGKVVVASAHGDIDLGAGTVTGYVKVSAGHTIDPSGTVKGLTGGNDPNRRTYDFSATLPIPEAPVPVNPNYITATVSSGRTFGDSASSDTFVTIGGKKYYYYVFGNSAMINLTGSQKLTVKDNCIFVMTSYANTPAIDAIVVDGSQGFTIDTNASLNIYTNGNITLTGNSYSNGNASPATFMIWGTNPTAQTIDIGGTADIKAVIDAPTAAVKLHGTVSVQGAVIGKTINLKGTPEFIADDALAKLTFGNPYGIEKWRELQTSAERSVYASQF